LAPQAVVTNLKSIETCCPNETGSGRVKRGSGERLVDGPIGDFFTAGGIIMRYGVNFSACGYGKAGGYQTRHSADAGASG
jgi:hypothetical protein